MMKKNLMLIVVTLLLAFPSFLDAEMISGRVSVIDGDTLEMHGVRIRLNGIDAPESGQSCLDANGVCYKCGQLAAFKMLEYVEGRSVHCEITDKDRYGRSLATCSVNDMNVNEKLVADGWALAYKQYSLDYVEAENYAREISSGLWSGKFIEPWKWRRGERLDDAKVHKSNDCLIKGNISSNGKIYHTPSSPWYVRTKIITAQGERWFCSIAEAEAAGWRAPK